MMVLGSSGEEPKKGSVEEFLWKKYREYARGATIHRVLYYALRLTAGLSAAVLPFVVSSYAGLATGLSVSIIIATTLDTVFNPKDHWALYSKATDLMTIAFLK